MAVTLSLECLIGKHGQMQFAFSLVLNSSCILADIYVNSQLIHACYEGFSGVMFIAFIHKTDKTSHNKN